MKLSDKFANLGPGGLARRILKETASDSREHAKPRPAAAPVVARKEEAIVGKAHQVAVEADQRQPARSPVKPKFDRAAYQRAYMKDYMRKKRAADKEAKE